ncbi:MAG: biotin--[acetyl-CoA-carboxylase] ligase [Tannerellaceae bacterium]|jgi:BirA family biotin operon repressor/biotin-[acetyl-CoA-carboxylase] ligase|nr:biotin--[acetyl-CoA-carboxylase] ligase [Tannerellaceae bacterium]
MNTSPIIRLRETASTNLHMLELLEKDSLPEGSVVTAEYQTAGRGQAGGSAWESAPAQNLTFSLLLRPEQIRAREQFILAQISALAVKETLDLFAGGFTVKWPNDVYWNNKKICGILIENTLMGEYISSSVVGIGLNVNQTAFPEMEAAPVSLRMITGEMYEREALLQRLLRRLFDRYRRICSADALAEARTEYRQALYRRDGFHPYRDRTGLFEACIADVEPSGHLLLMLRSGETRRYALKEVSCII